MVIIYFVVNLSHAFGALYITDKQRLQGLNAYHNARGYIRGRIPMIKTIASAITLTTGGSGGRERPIAQIGAVFGSCLATKLNLSHRERWIMMAASVAAGFGSIFRAPLAGALFAVEVL